MAENIDDYIDKMFGYSSDEDEMIKCSRNVALVIGSFYLKLIEIGVDNNTAILFTNDMYILPYAYSIKNKKDNDN